MTKEEIKALHSEAAAALFAEGSADERDRVRAHLTMGKRSGPQGMKIALDAIESGARLTEEFSSSYISAAIRGQHVAMRQAESDEVDAVLAGVTQKTEDHDLGDVVADMMDKARGKPSRSERAAE